MRDSLTDLLEDLPDPKDLSDPVYKEFKKLYLALRRVKNELIETRAQLPEVSAEVSYRVVVLGSPVVIEGAQVYANPTT